MLVMAKLRGVLLIRFGGKEMQKKVVEQFGEDEAEFLQKLSGKEGSALNSSVLSEMITAYLEMARSPIPALPLELALYRLAGENT